MLVDRHHGHGRGNPRPGIDQDDRLSARDGDRNFTRIAVLVHAIPLAGHLTAAFIRCRRLRVGGIDHPSHLGSKDARTSQGSHGAMEPGLQVPQIQLHQMLGQPVRANGPRGARALPLRPPRWQTPWRTCWAVQPTKRMSASALNNKTGMACMLSIPKGGFSLQRKRYCTTDTISH
jgi:hypothetical protein